MEANNIAIAFSTNSASDSAIKEISRDIKAVIGAKPISLSLLFFTPQYRPLIIKEVISIVMQPRNILAMQVPMAVFQGKVIKKGIVCCCFSESNIQLKSVFVRNESMFNIETGFRRDIMSLEGERKFILSAIGYQMNVYHYIRSVGLAAGRNFNVFGAGFMKKYGVNTSQILDDAVGEGISNIIVGSDMEVNSAQINGFLPLGRKFTITKIDSDNNRIIKVNNNPAALIYKKYLGEKFGFFKKTDFCSFYPIGVKDVGGYKMIQVLDFLEDDSILYFGEIKEGEEANIMMATSQHMLDGVKEAALRIRSKYNYSLIIVMDSILRRRILKAAADREIKMIKEILGDKVKLIGLYCDYQIFPGEHSRRFSIGNYKLSMMLINDRTG